MKSILTKKLTFAIMAFSLSHASLALSAEETTSGQTTAEETKNGGDRSDVPQGILPIPGYGGDIANRRYLTGDWNGKRTELASKHGFQFDIDSVTWTDTALDGGTTSGTEFGGNVTYNMKWDLMRAGILPGALLQLRAESRFGTSGILNTGQTVPMNTAALSPTNYTDFDDGYGLALTHLTYLQMLSGKFGVIAGKFDLYGDDGQGVDGYYNLALLPSARLSFNLQWLSSIEPDIGDTTMFSTRLQVVF